MPALTPVTSPPICVACALLMFQVPPMVASDNEVVELVQTVSVPLIADGLGLTVMFAFTEQPVDNV